jgi:CBS domain-containing membrane protein
MQPRSIASLRDSISGPASPLRRCPEEEFLMATMEERSLDLDLDRTGRGDKARQVARIAVVGSKGFTRDGSEATITYDCESAAALEREVGRLHAELDDALERGRASLSGKPRGSARARTARAQRASAPSPAAVAERARPRLSLPFTVADVMTRKVTTVGPNAPLAAAKEAMDTGAFRHLVVVADDGAIEGVLSHRDLFFGPLAWSIGQGRTAYEKLLSTSRVKDVMHREVVTIDGSATLPEAAALLREQKIGCLPVVEGERLAGLLTEGDLVALVADASP